MKLLNPMSDHDGNVHTVRSEQMKKMLNTNWQLKPVNIRRKRTGRSARAVVTVSQMTMTLLRRSSSVRRKKSYEDES